VDEELNENAAQFFKRERHEQQLGLQVGNALPVRCCIPGETDLQFFPPRIENPEPTRSDCLPGAEADSEGIAASGATVGHCATDVDLHIFGARDETHLPLMISRGGGCLSQIGKVVAGERFEADTSSLQVGNFLWPHP